VDGREANVVSTGYLVRRTWRNEEQHDGRFKAFNHWLEPVQAYLNQQHQHKVLA
jgi:hypothetical protein